MKIYKGKTQIGTLSNLNLVIDFDDLFRFHGEHESKDAIEKNAAKFVLFLGLFILIIPYLLIILNGSFEVKEVFSPTKTLFLIPYFSIFFILYSLFLNRNKNQFGENWEDLELTHVKKKIKADGKLHNVEIDNYLSDSVFNLIDKIYFKYDSQFLLALSDNILQNPEISKIVLSRLGAEQSIIRQRIIEYFKTKDTSFDTNFKDLFLRVFNEALTLEANKIDEVVLLTTLARFYWNQPLKDLDIGELEIQGLRMWIKNERTKSQYFTIWQRLSKLKPKGAINRAYTSKATPTLDTFGSDFTTQAATNNFEVMIGRESETTDLFRILERKNGAACLLIGEPGVGKTHFLRSIATKMVVEDVPDSLKDYRMVVIDLNKVFTKSSSIDNFKMNLQKILEEIVSSGNIVLVLEDFSQVLTIRTEGRLEVINLIVNMISQSNIKVIATTTNEYYNQGVKPLKNLASLFSTVFLNEPASNLSLQILLDEVKPLESKYQIPIRFKAIKRIVEFAPKFEYERSMPDKGIALLEESFITAKNLGLKFVDENTVDELLKKKTGVNVGSISDEESKLLQSLEQEMHKRVIGQDQAIRSVASALRRSRSGLASGRRPVASFLFYGPTGVGKTEVAKTLAGLYYGDEKLMIRLDMSEFHEDKNLNRLIGYSDSNGNYLGGLLTEAVKSRPFSLILLDELEKANPKVLDLFLQILDDGRITDGAGRVIDFSNTIIIATSNAASKEIAELTAKNIKYEDIQTQTLPELRKIYRIEFLNRFDKIVMFKPLNKSEVEQICEIMLNDIDKRLNDKGMDLKWNQETLNELTKLGYNIVYGARELRRIVQDTIEDKLADLIISRELVSGKGVEFDGLDAKVY